MSVTPSVIVPILSSDLGGRQTLTGRTLPCEHTHIAKHIYALRTNYIELCSNPQAGGDNSVSKVMAAKAGDPSSIPAHDGVRL